MGILFVSGERHRQLQRFRRRTWMTIALRKLMRAFDDAAFGLGLIEPTHQLAAQEIPACALQQDFTL